MRYVAWIVAAALLAACDSDPYMARKGGYTPGELYPSSARSAAYTSPSDLERNYRGIHPRREM